MRRGATMIEVLMAAGLALVLLFVAWQMLLAGRRGMARGEAKLDYLADAHIAFLALQRDLHAGMAEPELLPGGVLQVRRWQVSAAGSGVTTQVVSYARTEGASAGDVSLERRVRSGALPEEDREKRFCRGTLVAFAASAKEVAGAKAIEVTLTFQGAQDSEATRFRRLFVPRATPKDESWIPVQPLPGAPAVR